MSHVWSEGLGNPKSNSLPLCQLQYVQKRVNDVYRGLTGRTDLASAENVPFWMDTLCIPVGNEHRKARSLAITGMAVVYGQADVVLILSTFDHLRAVFNKVEVCKTVELT